MNYFGIFLYQLNNIENRYTSVKILLRSASMKSKNHNADISNPNKGTNGTNSTYDRNQGNRGGQMNPNRSGKNHK